MKSYQVILAIIAFMIVNAAPMVHAAGRISGPKDPAVRCFGEPAPADVCQRKREKALNSGCITADEYQALVNYGAFPLCDYDVSPPSLSSWCSCGCFDPKTRIYAHDNQSGSWTWTPAGALIPRLNDFHLAALDPASSMGNFHYIAAPIRMATSGPEAEPLYAISTSFGSNLKLTGEHAVLLFSGVMTTAKQLKIGDLLVGVDGSPIEVLGINLETPRHEVLNFVTENHEKLSHIIAAEGVLVGDLLWQASYVSDLNAIVIRKSARSGEE